MLDFSENTETDSFFATGEDFRKVSQIIDWMLSFRQSPDILRNLATLVRALGYPGLAAVLEGKASTGEGKVYLEGHRLCLEASSNRNGYDAMKRIGALIPRRGTARNLSVDVSRHEEFFKIVEEFWPCIEQDMTAVRAQAKQLADAESARRQEAVEALRLKIAAMPPQAPKGPVALLRPSPRPNKTQIVAPYVAEKDMTKQLVQTIRSLPRGSYWWNFTDKFWEISNVELPKVVDKAVALGYVIERQ